MKADLDSLDSATSDQLNDQVNGNLQINGKLFHVNQTFQMLEVSYDDMNNLTGFSNLF